MAEEARETYHELVEAALEDALAELDIDVSLISETDIEGQLRLSALKRDGATQILAGQLTGIVQAIVHLMYEMEKDRLYLYLPQEFSSLREWARHRFDVLVQNEVYTWDYLSRFIPFVTDVLIPMSKRFNKETGEVLAEPHKVLENASPSTMVGMSYFYVNADEDTKDEIASALASGAKGKEISDIKAKVYKQIEDRDSSDPDEPKRYNGRIQVVATQLNDGRYDIVMDEKTFHLVSAVMKQSIDFIFAESVS